MWFFYLTLFCHIYTVILAVSPAENINIKLQQLLQSNIDLISLMKDAEDIK